MFNLSTFQSEGHSQTLFHPRNIQKVSPSVQIWMENFENVDFAKVYLEYQDNSTLRQLLPHLVNQDSKSDEKELFPDF